MIDVEASRMLVMSEVLIVVACAVQVGKRRLRSE